MRYILFVLTVCFMCWNPALAKVSTLVADTKSGLILSASNSKARQYPASLTKVMTLYLTFNALENGLLTMNDKLPISTHAARQPKSKLYLKSGETITVREAVMALIVKSANDAAVVLSEALAPSEEDFAIMMTNVAGQLGMVDTIFKNASGLHHPEQVTTAQDMAVLTIATINHFPQYYKLFSQGSFTYKGRTYKSHNNVTKYYPGAEGLKTGFIAAVGYNIISTAKRQDNRLVTVVIGQNTTAVRDRQAMRLLDKGFAKIQKHERQGNDLLTRQAVVARPEMEPILTVMKLSLQKAHAPQKSAKNAKVLAMADETSAIEQGDTDGSWSVQVGAFPKKADALRVAKKAVQFLETDEKNIQTSKRKKLYRARVAGFESKREAEEACSLLRANKMQCLAFAPVS